MSLVSHVCFCRSSVVPLQSKKCYYKILASVMPHGALFFPPFFSNLELITCRSWWFRA
uniref:Uncharacterized protein n=1 Tax=Arundo donax TaxID=35708 RepID=A0A0A9D5I1_ARUDO